MTTVTESDLKRLEDLIINGQKAIESRFTAMESRFTVIESRFAAIETRFTAIENNLEELKTDVKALEVGQKNLEAGQAEIVKALEVGQTEIKGEIRTLDAKIIGLDKRTDELSGRFTSITLGFISVLGVFFTAITGIFAKIAFFPGNP